MAETEAIAEGYECSTPEGIGAARTRDTQTRARSGYHVLNARRHRSGENRERQGQRERQQVVLNARRHRSGENRVALRQSGAIGAVLNARRHRSGENKSGQFADKNADMCSTPEGIGAARTCR